MPVCCLFGQLAKATFAKVRLQEHSKLKEREREMLRDGTTVVVLVVEFETFIFGGWTARLSAQCLVG